MKGALVHVGNWLLEDEHKDAIKWLWPVGRWKASEFSRRRENVARLSKLPGRTTWMRYVWRDNQHRNVVRLSVGRA